MTTLNLQIGGYAPYAVTDGGIWYTGQSYQRVGYPTWSSYQNFGQAGLPANVTITSATFSLYVITVLSSGSLTAKCQFIDEANGTFPGSLTDANSRSYTTGVSITSSAGASNHWEQWDVTSDIQGLVNKSGWGTTSRIMSRVTSASPGSGNLIYYEMVGTNQGAKLDIIYTVPSTVFSYGFWSSFGRPLQHREGI